MTETTTVPTPPAVLAATSAYRAVGQHLAKTIREALPGAVAALGLDDIRGVMLIGVESDTAGPIVQVDELLDVDGKRIDAADWASEIDVAVGGLDYLIEIDHDDYMDSEVIVWWGEEDLPEPLGPADFWIRPSTDPVVVHSDTEQSIRPDQRDVLLEAGLIEQVDGDTFGVTPAGLEVDPGGDVDALLDAANVDWVCTLQCAFEAASAEDAKDMANDWLIEGDRSEGWEVRRLAAERDPWGLTIQLGEGNDGDVGSFVYLNQVTMGGWYVEITTTAGEVIGGRLWPAVERQGPSRSIASEEPIGRLKDGPHAGFEALHFLRSNPDHTDTATEPEALPLCDIAHLTIC